ncbi:E4 protein [Bos taurus papillomavirus 6]|uniref:E4 protein n=1 Tax=Bos taurus papillomavirus 6 TaxID=10563 RepID=Q705F2_BPV6|nr:E4 protein [Bos taurus papillomavirus 6]
MMAFTIQMQREKKCTMCTLQTMPHTTLCWDNGKCILKTTFFLLLLPVRFLVGPDGGNGPKPGATPLDTKPPSHPEDDTPPRRTRTPADGGRGRSRSRGPDRGRDHGRGRHRGRTPDNERRRTPEPTNPPVDKEDEEETEEEVEEEEEEGYEYEKIPLEDSLRKLLDAWETDLQKLRNKLHDDLLSL